MPLSKKGKDIMRNMKGKYGADKGESVFYASLNKGTISGVEDVPRGTKMRRGGLVKKRKKTKYNDGGMAYDVTHGSEDVPMEWGREKLDKGTEQLIKGTEFQVRGRYFNNNDGKGTF